jgi:transketolase
MLTTRHLRVDPADPLWPDRDRLFCAPDAPPPPGAGAVQLEAPPGMTAGVAVGAALAERMLAARFGRSLVDHRTWAIAGPVELAAGTTYEAAAIAGAAPLSRLTIVAHLPAAGAPALASFTALGWAVRPVQDGDQAAFDGAVAATMRAQKPTIIACLRRQPPDLPAGAAPMETADAHTRGAGARRAWLKRLRRHANAESFLRAQSGRSPAAGLDALAAQPGIAATAPDAAVHAALLRLAPVWPDLAGLAPDGPFAWPPHATLSGRVVPWGDRAPAQAAGLLGLALHGGVLPVGALPLAAAEAALPALRIAAALGLRTVHLVRETAPLPTSLLAALRALPGARVFRPADAAEALDCLSLALRHLAAPSLLLLADHGGAAAAGAGGPRGSARGGYRLTDGRYDVTLIASGADVRLALAARDRLAAIGIAAGCVSMPCWQLFAGQDVAYRQHVLGPAPRLALEAGDGFGWQAHLGAQGSFIDTRSQGDAASVAAAVRRRLGREQSDAEFSRERLGTARNFD